ncbi:DUF2878 domain-containing protein [Neptunomonas marina]|uniref:DUF2878 domain-containing protein n=1 Tax=Neptunomonas marina TaxID=1815562 RepID=A0A437Q4V5_9GAMM|nr:DUF2878 domain-containing protein [Neptunomonas marina]RVU29463.1 DUF2878 domain-containing protein [Neptunomonas marina]
MGWSERFWVNAIGFQAVWWGSILLGDTAAFAVLALLALHFACHSQPMVEARVVIASGVVGFSVDSFLTIAGVFTFPSLLLSLPPIWLLFLWFAFSATLRNSLSVLRKYRVLASVLGAVAGASTYIAAAKLGAVELSFGYLATFLLLLPVWAVLFPCLLILTEKLEESYVSHHH